MHQISTLVITDDGSRGHIDASNQIDDKKHVLVRMENGQELMIPSTVLKQQDDGSFRAHLNLKDLTAGQPIHESRVVVVPLITEEAHISTRTVESGKVRITKQVNEREEVIDQPGIAEDIEVKRVQVNKDIDQPATVRYEGDTVIVPLMEEVLVVRKQLKLKAELHITKRRREVRDPQMVRLRSEEAVVQRMTPDGNPE